MFYSVAVCEEADTAYSLQLASPKPLPSISLHFCGETGRKQKREKRKAGARAKSSCNVYAACIFSQAEEKVDLLRKNSLNEEPQQGIGLVDVFEFRDLLA